MLTRILLAAGIASFAGALHAQGTLTAAHVDTPPTLDGEAGDAAWSQAKPISVRLVGGANLGGRGETTATLKAVHTKDTLYLLLQYADPTESYRRKPYQKQADGSWKGLRDPEDRGGDENVYYEDKWSMLWSIGNSIKDFGKQGCALTCHVGEGKPFGNKYTAGARQLGDLWHGKAVRTAPLGQVDDQYLDHTRYDKDKSPRAGRHSDPKASGGYAEIPLVDGKPQWMARDAKPAHAGGRYFVKKGEEVPFDDARFKPGDEVAAMLIEPFAGDRGDIAVASRYANGTWTHEVRRKLVTGSKYDVQFDRLGASYPFGLAVFDNAQVRHAVSHGALTLRFAK